MPYRDQPEWLQVVYALGSFTLLAAVGTMAKVADEVKRGGRERFWTAKLWLEVPTVFLMGAVAYGVTDYWGLSQPMSIGLTAFMGWVGPKTLDVAVSRLVDPRGPGKGR